LGEKVRGNRAGGIEEKGESVVSDAKKNLGKEKGKNLQGDGKKPDAPKVSKNNQKVGRALLERANSREVPRGGKASFLSLSLG